MIFKYLLLLTLLSITNCAFASNECDIVSLDSITVFDEAWSNNAKSTYQEAQNGLMYFSHTLQPEISKRIQKTLDSGFISSAHKEISKSLSNIQNVIFWQRITLLKAKLELAIIKHSQGSAPISLVNQAKKDFNNFKTVYCFYYNNLNDNK